MQLDKLYWKSFIGNNGMNTYGKKYSRKKFITFLGKVTLGTTIIPPFLISCGNTSVPIKLGNVLNEQP